MASLPGAISNVPDGMASSVLVGVSPAHGLYASVAGPIAGSAFAGTRLMVVTTTSAASLAAGSALTDVSADRRPAALTLLTVLAGLAMILACVARLGRLTRFVSHSVMTGFLTGVALNIVFGQLGDLTGTHPKGGFPAAKAVDVLAHLNSVDVTSLVVGVMSAALFLGLAATRLAPAAAVVAVVLPTVLVLVLGATTVAPVSSTGDIPRGLPLPSLPDLSTLSPGVVVGALAVAAIVLVQGVGVAQTAPNPGGRPAPVDRDFAAQGAGNVAAGLLSGQPVGGSVGSTALNVASGAATRWAGVFSGVWIAVFLVAFSGVIGLVALPTLAALLMCAGAQSIRPGAIRPVFRANPTSAVAFGTTLVATLLLPIAAAVGIGVAVSLLLQLNKEAVDLRVVELVPTGQGTLAERPAPERLGSGEVTMLDVYGSLLYAGAYTLQSRLPRVGSAHAPAVVIRLRGRTQLGATFFLVLGEYARQLGSAEGRLFLSGVQAPLAEQFDRLHVTADNVELVEAEDVVGESSLHAYLEARAWLDTEGHRTPDGEQAT